MLALVAVLVWACGASQLASGGSGADDAGADAASSQAAEGGAANGDAAADAPQPDVLAAGDAGVYDPFAPQPDAGGGLTDVSSDLDAVLENGALADACSRYQAGQTDTNTTLLCGKWMFFYDPLGTSGMPAWLVQFLATNFPDPLGLGFSKLGRVPDPTSTTHMPLGIAPTVPLGGNVDAVAFTCASCHLAQLPDGRYSVGAPNHAYDYARHILDISVVPGLAMGLSQPTAHDPAAVAMVQPVLDALASDPTLKNQLVNTLCCRSRV